MPFWVLPRFRSAVTITLCNVYREAPLGSISIWHWIIVLIFLALYGIPMARILHRTGHSRWWVLPFFVPLLNLIGLWVLAFVDWPTTAPLPRQVPN